jgi:two-component sensor histidine kinase/CHASE3 domain sensor protein
MVTIGEHCAYASGSASRKYNAAAAQGLFLILRVSDSAQRMSDGEPRIVSALNKLDPIATGWRGLATPFALVLCWAAATSVISFVFFNWINAARDRSLETHVVLMALEQTLSAAKDAETGQRGYLITQKDGYLEPYLQGLADVGKGFKRLKEVKLDDAAQMARIDVAEKLWAAKTQELTTTLDVARTQGFDSARASLSSDRGKNYMDELRGVFSEITQAEQKIRDERRLDVTNLTRQLLIFNLLTTLTGFGVLLYLLAGARETAAELHTEVLNRQSAEDLARERSEQALMVRVMNRELVHRTKNLISVVQAIVRHQGKGTPELDRYIAGLSNRLVSLAGTLDILVRDHWTAVKLEDLIQSQLAHFAEDITRRVVVKPGPPVSFTASEAQMLGLALHELGTNAAKYGALSVKDGRINISWTEEPAEEGNTIVLHWHESGGPVVSPPERRGFGSRITESLVARAVSGTAAITYHPSGLEWTLTFNRNGAPSEEEEDAA